MPTRRKLQKVTTIPLLPNQRFAIIGKTGSGKTTFAVVLATTLVHMFDPEWEIWWLETKGDPTDIARLRRYGFVNREAQGRSRDEQWTGKKINYVYWRIVEKEDDPVDAQAQRIIRLAINRGHVLLVVDEYTQVVVSARNPGKWLGDAFRTGRGLNIGIIGLTQEPVYVPRQLLSQASHVFLFDLFYSRDIATVREFFPEYNGTKDQHGFWTAYIDGRTGWRYYANAGQWVKTLRTPSDSPPVHTEQPASNGLDSQEKERQVS